MGQALPVPDADAPSDAALIALVAGGNEKAFRELSDRYTRLIFSVAYRMRADRGAAEDIVQETLLRLWRHAGDWKADKGASVKTWLCRIATNLCIDAQRKGRHESGAEVPEIADAAPGAEGGLEDRDRGRLVGNALLTLPDRQRSALILFHYEGLSVAEVASVLKTTPKATEGLLGRARQALRQELKNFEGIL